MNINREIYLGPTQHHMKGKNVRLNIFLERNLWLFLTSMTIKIVLTFINCHFQNTQLE